MSCGLKPLPGVGSALFRKWPPASAGVRQCCERPIPKQRGPDPVFFHGEIIERTNETSSGWSSTNIPVRICASDSKHRLSAPCFHRSCFRESFHFFHFLAFPDFTQSLSLTKKRLSHFDACKSTREHENQGRGVVAALIRNWPHGTLSAASLARGQFRNNADTTPRSAHTIVIF